MEIYQKGQKYSLLLRSVCTLLLLNCCPLKQKLLLPSLFEKQNKPVLSFESNYLNCSLRNSLFKISFSSSAACMKCRPFIHKNFPPFVYSRLSLQGCGEQAVIISSSHWARGKVNPEQVESLSQGSKETHRTKNNHSHLRAIWRDHLT